jgi:hypothetical protein
MPAAILWATVIAWLLLVGVAVFELVRNWLAARRAAGRRQETRGGGRPHPPPRRERNLAPERGTAFKAQEGE